MQVQKLRELHRRGLSLKLVGQDFLCLPKLAEHVDHVDRDSNRTSLIGDRTGDGLANPPGRIRGEFKATAILVLIDSSHQTGVTLLDQIQETHATVAILFGDRYDQTEIATGKLTLDSLIFLVAFAKLFDAPTQGPGTLLCRHDQLPEFPKASLELQGLGSFFSQIGDPL